METKIEWEKIKSKTFKHSAQPNTNMQQANHHTPQNKQKTVFRCTLDKKLVKEFTSIKQAAEETGADKNSISAVCLWQA